MQIYQVESNSLPVEVSFTREGYVVDSKTQQFADFLVSVPTISSIKNPKVFLGEPGPKCHAVVKATVERNDGKMLIFRIKASDILNWNGTPPSGNMSCLIKPDPAFFTKKGTWVMLAVPLVVCNQPDKSIIVADHIAHCHFPLYYPLHNSPVAKSYRTDGIMKISLWDVLIDSETLRWRYDGKFRTSQPIAAGLTFYSMPEGDVISQMIQADLGLRDVIEKLLRTVSNKAGLTLHEQVRLALLNAQSRTPLDKVLCHDKDGKAITIATLTYLFNRDTYSKEDREAIEKKRVEKETVEKKE